MSHKVDFFTFESFFECRFEDLCSLLNGRGSWNSSDEHVGSIRFEDLTNASPVGNLKRRERGGSWKRADCKPADYPSMWAANGTTDLADRSQTTGRRELNIS